MVLVTALSLLVIAMAIPTSAQQLTATVSIDDITLPHQNSATLPIMITDFPENNVSTAQINLTYDSTVVQVTAVGGSDFDYFNHSIVDGKVIMLGYQEDGENLQAPIKFADVTVKAIGNPGDCTPLNLDVSYVKMGTGSSYHEYVINNGSVCIFAAVPVYNTFGMIALIGLLALVLAVAVRKR